MYPTSTRAAKRERESNKKRERVVHATLHRYPFLLCPKSVVVSSIHIHIFVQYAGLAGNCVGKFYNLSLVQLRANAVNTSEAEPAVEDARERHRDYCRRTSPYTPGIGSTVFRVQLLRIKYVPAPGGCLMFVSLTRASGDQHVTM